MSSFKRGTGFRILSDAQSFRNQVSNVLVPGSQALAGWTYGQDISEAMLAEAMIRDPIGHRITFHVSHDVFDHWFNLKSTKKAAQTEDFDQKLQEALSLLQAKAEWTKAGVFERGFGWSLLAMSYVDGASSTIEPVKNPTDMVGVKAYAPTQISGWDEDKDAKLPDGTINRNFGYPKVFKIRQKSTISTLDVHFSRCIILATRFTGQEVYDWQGQSALIPAFDTLVSLRRNSWVFSTAAYRLAVPFIDVTMTDAEDAEIAAYAASGAFDNLTGQKAFVHGDDRKLDFLSAEGKVLDPQKYALPDLERVSVATKIPLAILRGAQAGALTGSEVNLKEYFMLISNEQQAYENSLRTFINRVMAVKTETALQDYKFDWLYPTSLTEKEKLEIEDLKCNIANKRDKYFKRNEIRKFLDSTAKDLTAEEGGEEIVGRGNPVTQANAQGQPTNNSFVVQTNADGTLTVTELPKQLPPSKQH
jgi:hypothetical protein